MNDININYIDTKDYEFLDFGCSAGGSLTTYGKMFKANNKGLGLDIDPEKVRLAREKGFNAEICDITKLQLSTRVRFGLMIHFLEHIPSMRDVKAIIRKSSTMVDDFILIRQPYFDADPYLFSHGFKFFWSNWRGHPNCMTLLQFHNILMPMVSEGLIKRFSLYGLYPITSSEDSAIHNLDSNIDQHDWNIEEHTPKNNIEFTMPIYREVMAVVDINGNATDQVVSKIKPAARLFASDEGLVRAFFN